MKIPKPTAVNLADPPQARPPTERPPGGTRELGDSAALPRIAPRLRLALNRLHDHRAAPLAVPLGGAARVLHWVCDDAPPPPHDCQRFRLGPHAGRLGLDLAALAALLGEPRPERVPRLLRSVLLADALQACTDAVARATRLPFEWLADDDAAAAPPPDAPHALRFVLPEAGWGGFLLFDDPAALDGLVPAPGRESVRSSAMFDRLHVPLRFSLGSTRIRLAELRSVAPGDIVSIEDWRAAGAAVVVTAEVGGPAGRRLAGLAEGTRITLQQTRDMTMNRHQDAASAATAPPEAGEATLDRLDALEVSLRFEVGELQLSLGELKNIRAGHVFELGQPLNRSPVRILAHGNLLGKGTLVAVGDRLGVRVSEFAPGEL